MKQAFPPQGDRRKPSQRPSAFEFSSARPPYRQPRLTRHHVSLPHETPSSLGSLARRLALLAVVLGFVALWLHGGLARQMLVWARHAAAGESPLRIVLKTSP